MPASAYEQHQLRFRSGDLYDAANILLAVSPIDLEPRTKAMALQIKFLQPFDPSQICLRSSPCLAEEPVLDDPAIHVDDQ